MKKITESSNAKIILIGEHSVVYNKPAIALPIKSINTNVTIEEKIGQITIKSRYFNGALSDTHSNLLGIKKLIIETLNYLNQPLSDIAIEIQSLIPSERGMGSSAATAVALVRALFAYFDKPLTKNVLLKLVNVSEKIIHKNPSGIDSATSSASNPIWYTKNEEIKQIPINLDAYLVIADSGIKGKTSSAVEIVKNKLRFENESGQLIENLGELTTATAKALAENDIKSLGSILDDAQDNLRQLGVSHPAIETLIKTANTSGAMGSKLTGGGLGGCIIALCKDLDSAEKISNHLQQAGATATWIEKL